MHSTVACYGPPLLPHLACLQQNKEELAGEDNCLLSVLLATVELQDPAPRLRSFTGVLHGLIHPLTH